MSPSKDDKILLQSYKAREDTYKRLEAFANIGSWEVNLLTNESIWSDQSYKIYGLDKDTTKPTLELFYNHLVDEDVQRAKDALADIMLSGKVESFKCCIINSRGQRRDLVLNAKVIFDDDNIAIKVLGSTQDVTEYRLLERDSKDLSTIMQDTKNEIYIVDYKTNKYLYANNGACNALGYSLDELLLLNIYDINPNVGAREVKAVKDRCDKNNLALTKRGIHKRKDGSEYHVQSYIHKIDYQDKSSYVIFDTDITIQKELEDKLEHQATHDALTDLPNRILFHDRLSQIIKGSQRDGRKFALLFIDLDQFKTINDSLGHYIGDEVLKEIAYRLKKSVRGADTLARLGGDEFTIILRNLKDSSIIQKICKKINFEIKKPIIVNEHTLHISSSIGISEYPKDSLIDTELIRFADVAMYKAKEDGRDNFKFFNTKMSEAANERALLDSSLRIAIKEKQFIVYYQPQYNLDEGIITGMEALVRWQHPKLGLISPSKFIPLAEENGLIIEIDRIVMLEAMKQFALWYKAGLNPGTLALNLAMKQLNEHDFIEVLTQTMYELEFEAEWLELEVTEGQVMANPEESIKKLKALSTLGICIAIDDFGTGYSSLAYLKKLPLDKLKIDQSFVQDIATDEDDGAIAKAIIALAQSLNLSIIAEGVEEECQKKFLQKNGCNNFQGYLFAKPLPQERVTRLLQEMEDKNAK